MSQSTALTDVLLVGSVPLDTAKDVFTRLCQSLPNRLRALPDGETGERFNFVGWQYGRFPIETLLPQLGGTPLPETERPTYTLADIKPTLYDEVAITSYKDFLDSKNSGVIPAEVCFQICIPTPYNCIAAFIKPELQAEIEPLYEARVAHSIDRIVENLPHDDIVIQWDLAFDVSSLEHDRGRLKDDRYKAYFQPVKEGLIERLSRMCQRIPNDIKLAFHLCYGDFQHKHFIEPEDTSLLVELANDIFAKIGATHTIEWIHVPVPQDRVDTAYFEPLNKLQLDDTRLYLGLVHANDEVGTRERIRIAQAAYPHPFGVATECGLGRTPKEEIDSILSISAAVTVPH